MISKQLMPDEISFPEITIRKMISEDLPCIASWPPYPWPSDWANMVGNESAKTEDGNYWWEQIDKPDRCHYSIITRESGDIIGVYTFSKIDWVNKNIGNMGVRIHPDWRGKGIGSQTLSILIQEVLKVGIKSIRLDVGATGKHTIQLYRKCGMKIVDEFWREAVGPKDANDPKWAPLMPHMRVENEKWMLRFYWMEILNSSGV